MLPLPSICIPYRELLVQPQQPRLLHSFTRLLLRQDLSDVISAIFQLGFPSQPPKYRQLAVISSRPKPSPLHRRPRRLTHSRLPLPSSLLPPPKQQLRLQPPPYSRVPSPSLRQTALLPRRRRLPPALQVLLPHSVPKPRRLMVAGSARTAVS